MTQPGGNRSGHGVVSGAVIAVIALVVNVGQAQVDEQMYWTNTYSGVVRADTDGTGRELLVSEGAANGLLDVDPLRGRMCWTNVLDDIVRFADLEGNIINRVHVRENVGAWGVSLDATTGRFYWSLRHDGTIQSADFNGNNVQTIAVSGVPHGIAVDAVAGQIYYGDYQDGVIRRSNLDGTGAEDVVIGAGAVIGDLALHAGAGKIYWTNRLLTGGKIQRANLDGTNVETIVDGLSFPVGIDINVAGDQIYWTVQSGGIYRANLDGSGRTQVFAPDGGGFRGIAIVPEPATMSLLALGGLAMLRKKRK